MQVQKQQSQSAVRNSAYEGDALQACSEGSLFAACMTWAQQPDRNFDEVEQLLPLIRYPLMTHQELQVSPASLPPTS